MQPLFRKTFDCPTLFTEFPPRWTNANKKIVFDIACPSGTNHPGQLTFSRWPATSLPAFFPASIPAATASPDFFTYNPPPSAQTHWHLNFAHSDLFAFYRGPLLAQDEMQVAEHPILGSLRECLIAEGINTLTVDRGTATPILITGAHRRARIATDRNPREGRPHGLYGNAFARAPAEAITHAVARIDPPTLSNIIAIEAPSGGTGAYTPGEIRFILQTAFTAFLAAKLESAPNTQTVIHTGFWGCGAYGGNRELMTLLQLCAAHYAQINHITFHTGDTTGLTDFNNAQRIHPQFPENTEALLEKLAQVRYRWGTSDGN